MAAVSLLSESERTTKLTPRNGFSLEQCRAGENPVVNCRNPQVGLTKVVSLLAEPERTRKLTPRDGFSLEQCRAGENLQVNCRNPQEELNPTKSEITTFFTLVHCLAQIYFKILQFEVVLGGGSTAALVRDSKFGQGSPVS